MVKSKLTPKVAETFWVPKKVKHKQQRSIQ